MQLLRCTDFQNLDSSFEFNLLNSDKIELELNSREKGKIKNVPNWIQEAKSKNSKGLNYFKNNKKKKTYVDLPSDRIYSFYGGTGHLKGPVHQKGTVHCLQQKLCR